MSYRFRALFVWSLLAGPLSTGCGPLSAGETLPGTYHRRGPSAPGYVEEIRFTENKCILALPVVGEVALEYTVKDGMIYIGGAEGQICFHLDRPGVISNRGTLGYDGTYAKGEK